MNWFRKFPSVKQFDQMDCGPACLQMIGRFFKKKWSLEYLRNLCHKGRRGTTMMGLLEAARKLHFEAEVISLHITDLDHELLPCVAFWNQQHFLVVYKVKDGKVYVSDPAHGRLVYDQAAFLQQWAGADGNGIVLVLTPNENFYTAVNEDPLAGAARGAGKMVSYLKEHRGGVVKVFALLLVMGLLQLAFPYITQRLVDRGIQQRNLPYIYLLLLAQFLFFLGRTLAEVVNSYTLLRLGTSINIKLVSAFFDKLFRLPLGFFDVRMSGDILQRIQDHGRVEFFLTHGALNIFLSLLNLLIFGGMLLWYNWQIFLAFAIGSITYFTWFRHFMRRKAELDYKNFSKLSERQENNLEMIFGMAEIKLNDAAAIKKEAWEQLQQDVFRINYQTLKVTQLQQTGSRIINELKNIAITFIAALLVVQGAISLGEMMAVTYIAGQLNSPVAGILDFFQQYQDASLSTNRINEIHDKPDESQTTQQPAMPVPAAGDIQLTNMGYRYDKTSVGRWVLHDINLTIPRNKITAIVGQSGCGKTTLLKLLLRFYEPDAGQICIGDTPLAAIPHQQWRRQCGTVLQEAYIFNDTIAANIILRDKEADPERLQKAIDTAYLTELVQQLPMGLQTRIGDNGLQLSGGETQRVLIARAVYHDPPFVFFDEATSSLDAVSERLIVERLQQFFSNKTVVIIAHRLSTVQHADQIIVLDQGEVRETGTHQELVALAGFYHRLVKNQLELNG